MQNDTLVTIADGTLRGRQSGGVHTFRGIPFAAPPSGARRFRSPRPAAPWAGVRDALASGHSSLQALDPRSAWVYEDDGDPDEDCLTLNVFTAGTGGARPVLVWFHGGAFQTGHAGLPLFDGTALARDQDLVVVTCNYRLGPLGFLAHPDLRDPDTGRWANWGLQDQVAALRWVRANIAAFGGDPGNVTIAGESAGAMAVAHLARNPANRGLYHKLIGQSPARRIGAAAPPEVARDYAETIAASLGVPVAGLRDVPAWDLFRAAERVGEDPTWAARRLGMGPVLDNDVIVAQPHAAADGVPLLVGNTRDESRFWHCLVEPDGGLVARLPLPSDEAALLPAIAAYLATLTDDPGLLDPATLLATYRAALPGADAATLYLDLWTDGSFRVPATSWAAAHAAAAPAYLYEFAHPSPLPGVGSPHTLEIPFVFGTFAQPFMAPRAGDGPAEAVLSAAMRDIWAAFCRTGDPSTPATGHWPRYDTARRPVGILGGPTPTLVIADAPRETTRAAWDPLYAV